MSCWASIIIYHSQQGQHQWQPLEPYRHEHEVPDDDELQQEHLWNPGLYGTVMDLYLNPMLLEGISQSR